MKIGAIVIVNCDKDNIEYCLKGIYDACDKIIVVYSKCDWNGILKDDGTLAIVQSFKDPDEKIQVVIGEYTSQPGQRVVALDILKEEKCDYCFIVDSDEIYHPEQLQWARKVIEDSPSTHIFSVKMCNLWKTLGYVLLPDDRRLAVFYRITDDLFFTKSRATTYKTKVSKDKEIDEARKEMRFIKKYLDRREKHLKVAGNPTKYRRYFITAAQDQILKSTKMLGAFEKQEIECVKQIQTMFLPSDKIVCYHLTAVCDDSQMLQKIKTRSYKDSICPDWYHRKWLNWTYDMCNLHPTKPEQYEKAVPFNKVELPDFMKTHRFWVE